MTKKIRVLHVVGAMNRGGAETWLMHLFRHIDRERFSFDFLVFGSEDGAFDDEIRELGGCIAQCARPTAGLARFAIEFRRRLVINGLYDAIHCHVHHSSAPSLALARMERVPIRIAHSHIGTEPVNFWSAPWRYAYEQGCEVIIRRSSTHQVAVSRGAAQALFGTNWRSEGKTRISYCGIDLSAFCEPVGRSEARTRLGIPQNAFVVGHVGRFVEQKNHKFIVEMAVHLVRVFPTVMFLLIGDGPLRSPIQRLAEEHGLAENFIFAGTRDDIPSLMAGAMDAFVIPSWYEGLPIVGIEAQAAGIPVLFSDRITQEAGIVAGGFEFRPLDSPTEWASRIADWIREPKPTRTAYGWSALAGSEFDIRTGVAFWERIYGRND